MVRCLFYHVLMIFLLIMPKPGMAEEFLMHPQEAPGHATQPQKLAVIVEFGDAQPEGSKLDDAIQQAKKEFAPLESIALSDERELGHYLEGKPEGSIGMV